MVRGTTPTHIFELPEEFTDIELDAVYVTYSQTRDVIVEKELSDNGVSRDGNTITAHLTQDDTLRFRGGNNVEIQIRLKTADGEAMASDIISVPVERILKDGEI